MNSNLQSWLDDDALELPPIKSKAHPEGKVYIVPSPDIKTGMRLQALADLGSKVANGAEVTEQDRDRLRLNDDEERDFAAAVLGSAHDEMVDDGVSWGALSKAAKYAFAFFTVGEQAAERMVAVPKAPAVKAPQDRKPKAKKSKGSSGAK